MATPNFTHLGPISAIGGPTTKQKNMNRYNKNKIEKRKNMY
jgi:hypothetical protein